MFSSYSNKAELMSLRAFLKVELAVSDASPHVWPFKIIPQISMKYVGDDHRRALQT